MTGTNEAIIRRLVEEVVNLGNIELLTELVTVDHVGGDCLGEHYGLDGVRILVGEYRTAFPDIAVTIEDLIAAGDRVACRFTLSGTHAGPFMGIPPTARAVTAAGFAIGLLVNRRVARSWFGLDALGLLRQMGATQVVERPAPLNPSATPGASGAARA